jgi:uncharacterized protein (AIM24 family)
MAEKWTQKQYIYYVFTKGNITVDGEAFVAWMQRAHPEVSMDKNLNNDAMQEYLDEFQLAVQEP